MYCKSMDIINYVCMHAKLLHVRLFETLRMVVSQTPLSMGFSRQEYWSRLLWHSPRDLPDSGIKPTSLMPRALAGSFFTSRITWDSYIYIIHTHTHTHTHIYSFPSHLL